jgi:hypothetical protein
MLYVRNLRFVQRRDEQLCDSDTAPAARKLVELANAFEPVQDDRIYNIEKINEPFLFQLKGTPSEYRCGLERAIANGWLAPHECGTFVKLTEAAAALRIGDLIAPET